MKTPPAFCLAIGVFGPDVEEYEFDTAPKTLRQLMQQFIADSNG